MLNHLAKEFVPARKELALPDDLFGDETTAPEPLSDDSEEGITPADLDELEIVDEWVETMALCEEAEREHMITFALEHAPPELVEEIEQRAAALSVASSSSAGAAKDAPRKRSAKGAKPSRFHSHDA